MDRPYIICHIFSALDGAITGNYMRTEESMLAVREYAKIREFYHCDSILYGTKTMLDFCKGIVADLPNDMLAKREDFVFDEKQTDYVIAMDRHGKLAYESNHLMLRGKEHPIIEVLCENVSDAYLNYLQRLGISYIFAGKDDIDCRVCMEKLYRLFHIRKLMIAGGGYIDFAFADCGMMDELSLVLSPTADGEKLVTVFERNEKSAHPSLSFSLLDVKNMGNDTIWLRYQLKNKDGIFQGDRI